MKILLIGSQGKMGKLFCKKIAEEKTDQIVAGIDIQNNDEIIQKSQNSTMPYLSHKEHRTIWSIKDNCDIIIDFSTTQDKGDIISFALLNKLPLAIFSTTCSDKDKQDLYVASKHIPVLVCPNTSLGINAMFDAINILGEQLHNSDVALFEHHHKHKLDTPSGTAKSILKILENNGHNNISINALRVGDESGYHSVTFFMQGEKVTLSHTATTKEIFVTGAIDMAKKLIKKQSGFYSRL